MGNPLVQVDPGLYIWTIFTFLVLVFLLKRFAWAPLLKALDERQKTIAAAVDDARQAREQLERAQQDSGKVLAQARVDAEDLLIAGESGRRSVPPGSQGQGRRRRREHHQGSGAPDPA